MDTANAYFSKLCEKYKNYNNISPERYSNPNIKRGLRNADGTGVVAGLTQIGNVHGYIISEGDVVPIHGELTYRGVDVADIISGCRADDRMGFEEVAYLLLFGTLPSKDELTEFSDYLASLRELPPYFTEDMIIKAPSRDIMNKMARSVLALYSYDDDPDDNSLPNLIRQSLQLVARMPIIAAHAYQVKKHYFDKQSMHLHFPKDNLSTAGNFLRTIRPDKKFTHTEAMVLDSALIVHAEHGGGNNSAFACRVLSSSDTDTYSAVSAAIGSLKGRKHGGASLKVNEMFDYMKDGISNWENDDEIASYLEKIVRREAGDGSGLIYGMGHAVYTLSDPRATLLKQSAAQLAQEKDMLGEFALISAVERLAPDVFSKVKGDSGKIICANVDLYSGFVYRMLDIPQELFTPLFAISRIVGWCAHRIEETIFGGRIIRPAYKSITKREPYTPLERRA